MAHVMLKSRTASADCWTLVPGVEVNVLIFAYTFE
jgi:hypothetical protein